VTADRNALAAAMKANLALAAAKAKMAKNANVVTAVVAAIIANAAAIAVPAADFPVFWLVC